MPTPYTKVPNSCFDLMPELTANEWRVLCVVIRKTAGFNKKSDVISLSQFKKMTGISGIQHIRKSIVSLVGKGVLFRSQSGQSFIYQLGTESTQLPGTESTQLLGTEGTMRGTESTQLLGTEGTTQKKRKKEEKERRNIDILCDMFLKITGIPSSPHPSGYEWQSNWEPYLLIWSESCKDNEKIAEAIKTAANVQWAKTWSIKSPKTLQGVVTGILKRPLNGSTHSSETYMQQRKREILEKQAVIDVN